MPRSIGAFSVKREVIQSLQVKIYGLDDVSGTAKYIDVVWLLHGRLKSQDDMATIANNILSLWHKNPNSQSTGVIAISFDQRNHGSRLVDDNANQSWKQGNDNHAVDMYNIYHGTATDTTMLIDALPSHLTPDHARRLRDHHVLGVSLGGHAAWDCVFGDKRIKSAVIVIGCPDYVQLMRDRAFRSKLPAYMNSDPVGAAFIGSKAFPSELVELVNMFDPAARFLATSNTRSEQCKQINQLLHGKRIQCLSGGKDKLVPYHCGERFMQLMKEACKDAESGRDVFLFRDIVHADAGHEFSSAMQNDAARFLVEAIESGADLGLPTTEPKI